MIANPLDPDPDEPEFFLYHRNGPWLRATFGCAADARVWLNGNEREPWAEMFFVTDGDGKKVEFGQNVHGHAYAIAAAS